MTADLLLALVGFAFATSATPGPNNIMLLASGVNFGFRRTIPHMLGVGLGFTFMIFVLGLGLSTLFQTYPAAHLTLRYVGGAYMLWLAWKIGTAGAIGPGKAAALPLTFMQAALFQWVNPKAWVMAIAAIASYTVTDFYIPSLAVVCVVFGLVNIPSIGVWAGFGTAMRRMLDDPKRLRVFNIAMAILLVASMAPLLLN
ncbi:MAG: LysE family translocator [Hyphomicrobiales bacterium]